MVRVSVVIATYNNARGLHTTLDHLSRQDHPKDAYEVVVVDDGSTDGTARVVQEWSDRLPARYVRQDNSGRSVAKNRGAREAIHEVLLFMDSDIWAEPNVLRCHTGHHVNGGRVGVQGPVLVHPDSRVNTFMQTKWLLPDMTMRRKGNMAPYHMLTPNFSVRAEDFWGVGGFDEGFRGYGLEDIDLAYRLHRSGVRLEWEPDAKAWHFHVEDLPAALRKQVDNGVNAVYFWNKHGRPLGLGLFLEILPVLWPLKWLVYKSGISPLILAMLRWGEGAAGRWNRARILPLLVTNEYYRFALSKAYYEGVFRALREKPAHQVLHTEPDRGRERL